MRWLALVLLLGCGGDDKPAPHADAGLTIDGAADGATLDGAAPDAASSLGRLCATTAVDGGPGSCVNSICCNAGQTTICTLPDDCSTGGGYEACAHSTDCQGSICCHLELMTFCTKPSACAAYGGKEVP